MLTFLQHLKRSGKNYATLKLVHVGTMDVFFKIANKDNFPLR